MVFAETERREGTPDPLAERGYRVTEGAAPGYVDDRLCASCHTDLFNAYQEVAMAKAFHRPTPEKVIEDFANSRFLHEKSGRYYEMSQRGERYYFKRYQLDDEGRPINIFEQPVDWILGSGSHVRTYLYQTPGGYLFQLPVAWYTRTAHWGMAPGYDRPSHNGVTRLVTRECMFCHSAYPEVPADSDVYGQPHVFPAELPDGLGCQRCHGPGAEHSRIGMQVPVDFQRLAEAIVNPADLSPAKRDDICYGCHMQPAVVADSVRRFGRGDFSFVPGEDLSSYMVQVDVEEEGRPRGERFEINHHPYRLEQSRCFIESQGALSCLTCHDPHRKVQPEERPAHYRAACQGCHSIDACRLDEMLATSSQIAADLGAIDPGNCVACHMQERRPQDAVQVTMTDHLIRRRPGGDELLAPLEETDHALLGISVLDSASAGPRAEAFRAVSAIRVASSDIVVDWLQETLEGARVTEIDPYLDLARGQIEIGRPQAAQSTLKKIFALAPDHPQALLWQGLLQANAGQREEALTSLRRAVASDPAWPQSKATLGRLLSDFGRAAEALQPLREALASRPNQVETHLYLGRALAALGRLDEAAASYRRALQIEPAETEAYLALGQIFVAKGDLPGARRFLHHGARAAARPEAVQQALAQIGGGGR
ncbi:MAG: tetratricopeptide repeat protein [Acidobacteriota bacterium]